MRTKAVTFLLSVLLAVFLWLPGVSLVFAEDGPDAASESGSLTIQTIAAGPESAYPCQIPMLVIVRDMDDWRRVWNLHHGRDVSNHQLPDVDFESFSVIALFAGRSPAIENIQIVRYEHVEEGGVMVSAVEVEPGLGCTRPKNGKNPFHIVRIPALDKRIIPTLEIEILSRNCRR